MMICISLGERYNTMYKKFKRKKILIIAKMMYIDD